MEGLRSPNPNQIGKLTHFSNYPLQFFLFIWYKQFTESSVWLAGCIVCNSRRASGI
jgi:hypothetical protein